MTYREQITERHDNLGWCKPLSFLDGKVVVVIANGNVTGIQIDGKDISCEPANIKDVAKMVNVDYGFYRGWSDSHIIEDADPKEMPCCECPWFAVCDAMDG